MVTGLTSDVQQGKCWGSCNLGQMIWSMRFFFSSKNLKSQCLTSVERRVPISRITTNKISFHNWVIVLYSGTRPYLTLVTPWTEAHQAPLSMEFSRQEYWSGLLFPPPGDLPNPGIEPSSLASPALAGGFFTTSAALQCCRKHLLSLILTTLRGRGHRVLR